MTLKEEKVMRPTVKFLFKVFSIAMLLIVIRNINKTQIL